MYLLFFVPKLSASLKEQSFIGHIPAQAVCTLYNGNRLSAFISSSSDSWLNSVLCMPVRGRSNCGGGPKGSSVRSFLSFWLLEVTLEHSSRFRERVNKCFQTYVNTAWVVNRSCDNSWLHVALNLDHLGRLKLLARIWPADNKRDYAVRNVAPLTRPLNAQIAPRPRPNHSPVTPQDLNSCEEGFRGNFELVIR
ncbi:hypothetical protein GQX74_000898 [Glossina fuscipes]|nr:hypothetical protein GQX74_000898 [Glossina fuscipes]